MELTCSICLAGRGRPNDAETIIRGFAVCAPHIPVVARGPEWAEIIAVMRASDPGARTTADRHYRSI